MTRHKNLLRVLPLVCLAVVLPIGVILAGPSHPAHAQLVWSSPVNLSQSKVMSTTPDVAVDADGHPHVVWAEETAPGQFDVFYRMWDGATWSSPVNLSEGVRTTEPQIAINGGRIHVIWRGTDGLYYRQHSEGFWSPALVILPSPPTYPALAIAADTQGRAHVLFTSLAGSPSHTAPSLMYTVGQGDEWSEPVTLSTQSGAGNIDIAVDSQDRPHVVWDQYGVALYRFQNGVNWSPPTFIFVVRTGQPDPAVAIGAADRAQVVWSKPFGSPPPFGPPGVWHAGWDGAGFGDPQAVADGGRESSLSLVADAAGRLTVAWTEESDDGSRIFTVTREAGVWQNPISVGSAGSTLPRVVAGADGTRHLVFVAGGDVFYARAPLLSQHRYLPLILRNP